MTSAPDPIINSMKSDKLVNQVNKTVIESSTLSAKNLEKNELIDSDKQKNEPENR